MSGENKAAEATGTHVVRQAGRVYLGTVRELGSGEFWFEGRRVGGSEILQGKFNTVEVSALEEGEKEGRKE
ncbi:MAG: hypothetical protein Q7S70_02730 [bacterium]|nr:hypothetical protein [bacterium]